MRMRAILFLLLTAVATAAESSYFRISAIDEKTLRGVPMVEFKTVNGISHWTDSNGLIAFNEPGLMDGNEVWFHIQSDGYSFPKDGFGNVGVRLKPQAGGSAVVKIKRENIAERIYRVTGQGIYRDTILLGEKPPIERPALNSKVLGQDSVITANYRGKLFWFWGDTEQLAYPLGNYLGTGATSDLPSDLSRGVNLNYFERKDGFTAPMFPVFGKGLQWIESAFVVKDPYGRDRLVSRVSSHDGLKPPHAWHFAVWNDEKNHFEPLVKWENAKMAHDTAHSFRATVAGTNYIYVYANYRVQENWRAVTNLARYEAFTSVGADGKADRDANGKLRWAWRAGAERLSPGRERQLIKDGAYKREEGWMRAIDVETTQPIDLDRGSVYWNEYRKRWIMIGWAKLKDIYYSEALAPTGPWEHARRVVTHRDYTFYNPTQHAWADDGKFIYLEGTYTQQFSSAKEKTPRYDYNQIMYRLDLADDRLKLPDPAQPFEASIPQPNDFRQGRGGR